MPFDPGHILLHHGDLLLRPLTPADAPDLAAAAAESRDTYQYTAVPDSLAAAHAAIRAALTDRDLGTRYPFAILHRSRLVGTTSFYDFQPWHWPATSPHHGRGLPDVCEIGGTWLAASAQRTACNTTAKFLLLTHAFDTWRVHRVMFRTDARNTRSRTAIDRLGARFEGIHRVDKPAADGSLRDSAFFSITAPEWPPIRTRLTARAATTPQQPPTTPV